MALNKVMEIVTRQANIALDTIDYMPASLVDDKLARSLVNDFKCFCNGVRALGTATGAIAPTEYTYFEQSVNGAVAIINARAVDKMGGWLDE